MEGGPSSVAGLKVGDKLLMVSAAYGLHAIYLYTIHLITIMVYHVEYRCVMKLFIINTLMLSDHLKAWDHTVVGNIFLYTVNAHCFSWFSCFFSVFTW